MSSAARHYYHENPNSLDSKKAFINPNERFLPLGLAIVGYFTRVKTYFTPGCSAKFCYAPRARQLGNSKRSKTKSHGIRMKFHMAFY